MENYLKQIDYLQKRKERRILRKALLSKVCDLDANGNIVGIKDDADLPAELATTIIVKLLTEED